MKKTEIPGTKKSNYLFFIYHALILIAVIYLLTDHLIENNKIAYVDSGRILNEFKGSEDAKKAFQVKAKGWQSNIDTLTNEVKASIQRYEKSMATMSKKEQDLTKELIQSKQKQLNDYQHATDENAKEENGKLTQKVVTEINAFLSKYGKRHHYKLILISNQSGTIAYAKEGLDITAEVLEELNNDYSTNAK